MRIRLAIILILLLVFLVKTDNLEAQTLPDLVIDDIKISKDPDNPTKLIIIFSDASPGGFFQTFYDNERQRRIAEGMSANPENIFPFTYELFFNNVRVDIPSTESESYIPRSGRKIVVTPPIEGITAGRPVRKHKIKVNVQPLYFMDRDMSNNSLEKELSFTGLKANIVIDRLRIKDDCDEVSEGDWMFLITVRQRTFLEIQRAGTRVVSVDSGDDIRPRSFVIPVEGILQDEPLNISVNAVDCDMDGPLTIFYNPLGFIWLPATIASWVVTCGGEEAWELSGQRDIAGAARFSFTPDEWKTRIMKSSVSTRSVLGPEECGSGAFTVDLHIEHPPVSAPSIDM